MEHLNELPDTERLAHALANDNGGCGEDDNANNLEVPGSSR